MQKTSYRALLKMGIIAAFVLIITGLHYTTSIENMYLHQIYQRAYYIPIILASFWFEIWGGLATAIAASALYLIHIMRDWAHSPSYSFEQYAEIAMYLVVAVLAGSLSRVQRKARQRLEAAGAELSAAYKKLNETFEQLRHSDRLASLGELAAGIAHEVRNPLGSIQGAVEILSEGLPPSSPKLEFAQIAKKEVAVLDKLVNEILRFSKPTPPRKIPTDLAELVEAAYRLCADQALRQNVDIVREFDATIPKVLVDPEQIKQVLLNIMINAIQIQPQGGKVLIRIFRDSEELVVSMQDSGPGIKPEHFDRIFDPFFTTKRDGTGLGLSISYQLVSGNGGRIRATSPPGKGACFILSFPVAVSSPTKP